MLSIANSLVLVFPLALGILIGYFLRDRRRLNIDSLILGVIIVLIFCLGFSMGSNGELLAVLPSVGLTTIVLLAMTLLFSIIFVKAARRIAKA
jgi:4-hydroxybenzoate polyprenyltransferase